MANSGKMGKKFFGFRRSDQSLCVCVYMYVCVTSTSHVGPISPDTQMEDRLAGGFDGRRISAPHRSEGSGAWWRRRGWSLLVTHREMEDSIRHAISQPGTPVERDRLGPSISLHYLLPQGH